MVPLFNRYVDWNVIVYDQSTIYGNNYKSIRDNRYNNAAFQYGTTGEINAKEVVISGVTGAVTSLIPVAGAGIGAKIAQTVGKQSIQKGVTIAAEVVMNMGVSAISSYCTNKIAYPGEKSNEEIINEMLASTLTAGALSTVASIFNHTIGKMLAQKLNCSKNGAGYAAAGASGGYNPNDPLGKGIRQTLLNEALKEVRIFTLLNKIYSSAIDTNGAWWSHVLVQELTKILENREECSE